ncbi:MAG: translation initiation factor IF-2 [Nitrospirae bacterium]|nr:translation initiation factor IF-2 [Nitrospirota bacterium]
MPKISELAQDLKVDSKDIIKFLGELGIVAKSSTKNLNDEVAQKVRDKFSKPKGRKFSIVRQVAAPASAEPTAAAPAAGTVEVEAAPPIVTPAGATPAAPGQPPSSATPAPKPAAPTEAAKGAPKPAVQAGGAAPKPAGEIGLRPLIADKGKKAPEKPIPKVDRPRDLQRVIKEEVMVVHTPKASPVRREAPVARQYQKTAITTPKAIKRRIRISGSIPITELAKRMSLKANEVIKKLMGLGVKFTSLNQSIDADAAGLVAQEFGFEIENTAPQEPGLADPEIAVVGEPKPRAPVVTIMGHVDHGKTSLLDAIRKTNVAEKEAGGITQHIGAYQVQLKGKTIAFLDTPGHEAFTEMRARGAKVTDLVILVVAGDDGAMPQTFEAVDHAKAAGVSLIVALNKMDKPDCNPRRVMQQLAEKGLNPEEWGGDTLYAHVSAKTGMGLDDLLEKILLQSDVLELKSTFEGPAKGTIIESKLDKTQGPVATVLVQQGKLKTGDVMLCGATYGRLRAMSNEHGERLKEAGPSTAIEIVGLSGVPVPGDTLLVLDDERKAADIVAVRGQKLREAEAQKMGIRMSVQEMLIQARDGSKKQLGVILKTDVQGSMEAVRKSMAALEQAGGTEKVTLNIIRSAVGNISTSDIMLASASKALVVGFNVRTDMQALQAAEKEKVEILNFNIIYELLEKMTSLMKEELSPVHRIEVIGHAEVRQVFKLSTAGVIAGCFVKDGKVNRNAFARVVRENAMVHEGKLGSLKRFKDDAREVPAGLECGIAIANYEGIKVGDLLEFYTKEEVAA